MPLLSLLTKKEYRKTLWLTVTLYFIFNSLIPNILVLFQINYNPDLSIQIGRYVIFVILGYLLSTQEINKKKRALLYLGAFIGIIFRYTSTYILSKQIGSVVKITWGYTSWHSILLACAVFVFVKNIHCDNSYKHNASIILMNLSNCSFGIYLIHRIIIYYEIHILQINTASWQWRTIGVITTYLICVMIVMVMKKIPILSKIVP